MKSTVLFFCAIFVSMLFASCSFKETLVLNPDGSGQMSIVMDGAQLMEKAGANMGKEAEKRMDTTISFKSIFADKKDSIAKLPLEQREALKNLERFDMHLLMDAKQKQMLLTMKTDFKSIDELGDMMKGMTDLSKLKGKKSMGLENNRGQTSYSYNGSVFKRIVKMKSLTAAEREDLDKSMKGYGEVFGESTYTIEYVFPKKIKSVSAKDAKISGDGKTLTITKTFMDYIDHPEALGFEVRF